MTEFSISDLIIYNNNQLIAVNKPAGISSQKDPTEGKSLQELVEIYCKHPVQIVHRLDRPASGVLLFAKNKKAVAHLHKQFQDRTVEKTYLAIVGNRPAKDEDTLQHNLVFSEKVNKSFPKDEDGKSASLHYKWLGNSDRYFLLKVNLLTGRQHQIRAQLAEIGCPIRGDVKYGFKRGNKDRSIQLHSFRLFFTHPVSGKKETLSAPCPDLPVWNAFRDIINDL